MAIEEEVDARAANFTLYVVTLRSALALATVSRLARLANGWVNRLELGAERVAGNQGWVPGYVPAPGARTTTLDSVAVAWRVRVTMLQLFLGSLPHLVHIH